MIEESGQVIHVNAGMAEVQISPASNCGRCAARGSCSTSLLEHWLGRKPNVLRVSNSLGLQPGDSVILGIPEGDLLRAALQAYLVPLLTLLFGAMGFAELATHLGTSEMQPVASLLGAGLGFGLGLWWFSRWSRKHRLQPKMLRRTDPNGQVQLIPWNR